MRKKKGAIIEVFGISLNEKAEFMKV